MSSILERIAEYKRGEVADAKRALPLADLEVQALDAPPVRGFRAALEARIAAGDWALVAEIKKASPSKGLIRADFNPPELAIAYEAGGAACLSVLTDKPSFQGAPEFLLAARTMCGLPALQKGFHARHLSGGRGAFVGGRLHPRHHGAWSMTRWPPISPRQPSTGAWTSSPKCMTRPSLQRALKLDTRLIGINNRDLKTFETRLEVTERLVPEVPADKIVIAESGLNSPRDLARLSRGGVNAFLIGESLMRQADVEAATRAILDRSASSEAAQ